MDYANALLDLGQPERAASVRAILEPSGPARWARLQHAFLEMIAGYIEEELSQAPDNHIDSHEAGGQWRIAFPHLAVRHDDRVLERFRALMAARKAYTDKTFFHGFPDEAEVHHEIETFLYFQLPLLYHNLPGSELALASIEDVAHHVGNWEAGVPDWYDWEKREFKSTWLGTRGVRDFPPYDYQEANHFRFIAVALAAYLGTAEPRYLEVATDYAGRWCEHIEEALEGGQPITCSILPRGVAATELGRAGAFADTASYKVFYSSIAANTAYDIVGVLLDLYRMTGTDRYLACARALTDQFFDHAVGKRPALAYLNGQWQTQLVTEPFSVGLAMSQPQNFIARMALRHDTVTGSSYYRDRMLSWANEIDECFTLGDQHVPDVMVAAHYYSGDSVWLERAYAMALRAWAALEDKREFHMCSSETRQGSKFLMELLYQPLLGGCDWGTRGHLPIRFLRHRTGQQEGIPEGVAFRTWQLADTIQGFEAVNKGSEEAVWTIEAAQNELLQRQRRLEVLSRNGSVDGSGRLRVPAGGAVTGEIHWSEA